MTTIAEAQVSRGTGPTARMAVSKTAGWGSIPWSPALDRHGAAARRTAVAVRPPTGRHGGAGARESCCLPPDPDPSRAPPPTGLRGDVSAPRRLDENQLAAVQHLRDRARLLDLRVRVANRVVQGLDVDAWDLHDVPVCPVFSVDLSSASRVGAMRSEVFARSVLDERVTLVTGGGTGLGKAAARELAACGARVVIAGRREEVLAARGRRDRLGGLATSSATCARTPTQRGSCAPASSATAGSTCSSTTPAASTSCPPRRSTAKGWRAVTRPQRRRHRADVARTAVELAMRPAGGGTIINVTLSPHHGLPGMTHSSAARAAVEGYTRALAREWAADGIAVVARRGRPLRHRVAAQVPRGRLARAPPAPSRCSASAARRSTPGSSRCRLAARPRAVRLGGHARRRPRQLVRPLAAGVADRRGGRRADRGAPPARRPRRARLTAGPLRAKCCGCTEAFQASRAGSIPVARSGSTHHGEWRSLVAHPAGGRAVAGSNPVSPTQGPESSRGLREPQEAAETPAPEANPVPRTAP